MGFRKDGLHDFVLLHDVYAAFKLNQNNTNIGTNTGATAGTVTLYGQADIFNYDGFGSMVRSLPTPSSNFDIFTTVDAGMLLYLPTFPSSVDTTIGLWHNGGGTNAQAGHCRYDSVEGWQINVHANASGSNQDDIYYTLGFVEGWYALGFQFEDNFGNMALWIDGVKVAQRVRTFELLYGSGDPWIGGSNSDNPPLWSGNDILIQNEGLIIANFFAGNTARSNPTSGVLGYGDILYEDYYEQMVAAVPEVLKVWDSALFEECVFKRWDGFEWKPVRYWNGTTWKPELISEEIEIPVGNIIAEYKFEGNVIDTMGINDGNPTDITYEAGPVGQVAVFNGTSSIVKMDGSAANLDFDGVDFSVSQMYKSTDSEFRLMQTRGQGSIGLFPGFQVSSSNGVTWGNMVIDGGDGIGNSVDMASVPYNEGDGVWHHIVFTWTTFSGTMKFYIDGVVKGIDTNSSMANANLNGLDLVFGGSNQNGHYLDGSADCARIWNKVLSAAEIALIASNELGGIDINPESTIPLSSIIAEYKFELNANDSVNSHNGVTTNVTYAPGLVGNAAAFNGNSNVIVPDSDDFTFTLIPFSITFLVRFGVVGDAWLVNKRAGSSVNCEYQCQYYQGNVGFSIFSGGTNGSYIRLTHPWTPDAGQWYHITVTYDGSTDFNGIGMYIDGVAVGTSPEAVGTPFVSMMNTGSPLVMGEADFNSGFKLNGNMDCVRMWGVELSEEEVLSLATLELGGTDVNI